MTIKRHISVSAIMTLVIPVVLAFIILTGAGLLLASDEQDVPGDIVLDEEICGKNDRTPVEFSHLSHAEDYGLSCNECHHDYMDGENVWEEGDWVNKCIDCHDPCESDGNIKKLKIAFHRNCIGCHKEIKGEWGDTDAPFRACRDCHRL